MTNRVQLEGIECLASIGVFDWERRIKQTLHIDLDMEALLLHARLSDSLEDTVDYKQLTRQIIHFCQNGHFALLERLVEELAQQVMAFDSKIVSLNLTIHKSGALRHARNVNLHCHKARNQVIVTLGSNINPEAHIKQAVACLRLEFPQLKETGWLTTRAVARPNDPDFINTAVMLSTALSEQVLQRRLKHIEYEMGRERNNNDAYAPRVIDIDLLLWNDRIVDADIYQRAFLQTLIEQLAPGMLHHLHHHYQLPVLIDSADAPS